MTRKSDKSSRLYRVFRFRRYDARYLSWALAVLLPLMCSCSTFRQERLAPMNFDDVLPVSANFKNVDTSSCATVSNSTATEYDPQAKVLLAQALDQCNQDFIVCMAAVPSVNQCISENYPARCIDVCNDNLGDRGVDCSIVCQPTPKNLQGWQKRCNAEITEARTKCREERRECQNSRSR